MSIRNLPLAAKTVVDGFMSGIHSSRAKGVGMEFSQYRSYEAGDDLRRLDWKLFARSDRYYIRESEVERTISVQLIIDASASMNHEDNGITKIEYARYLAASLAYLASSQGDSVGLHVLQNNSLFSLPSKKDSQHLARVFHQLETLQPAGRFTEPSHYKSIFSGSKKELLIVITDYYEKKDEITMLLQSLAAGKHEMIVFHLLGKNEVQPHFSGYTALEDWETGETIQINTTEGQTQYRQQFENYINSVKNKMLSRDIFYEQIVMNEPLDKALRDFLNRRNKLNR